jgi:hypothetical protein
LYDTLKNAITFQNPLLLYFTNGNITARKEASLPIAFSRGALPVVGNSNEPAEIERQIK